MLALPVPLCPATVAPNVSNNSRVPLLAACPWQVVDTAAAFMRRMHALRADDAASAPTQVEVGQISRSRKESGRGGAQLAHLISSSAACDPPVRSRQRRSCILGAQSCMCTSVHARRITIRTQSASRAGVDGCAWRQGDASGGNGTSRASWTNRALLLPALPILCTQINAGRSSDLPARSSVRAHPRPIRLPADRGQCTMREG